MKTAVDTSEKSSSVILNVDDNDGARDAKTRTLRLAGFDVIEAENGPDALVSVQLNMPDLVLLDIKLPDTSGLEVCRKIKQNPKTTSVMVLQTSTALIDSGDRMRDLDEGADNYLAAPVEPLELIANVNALLRLREAQRALYENEERFRQMAENIGDVFWIFDPQELQLLYVSPAYEKLWNRAPHELYKNLFAWQENIHPEDRPRVQAAFAALLNYQDYEEEYRLQIPGGSQRWIRDRGFAVRNANGDNYRITRISQDISASNAAAVALRNADIRKDEFLATLAHELRNPLALMRTAVELMQRSDIGKIVVENTEIDARGIISRQIDHLVRLVDDLLDLSRFTQGKLFLQKSFVELQAIVSAALETNEEFIRARKHKLSVHMPSESVWLHGDSVRVAQVLSNLLNNAAKYTPDGGEIDLTVSIRSSRLQISVTDNGIGIAADQMNKIFDLFTQAQRLENRAVDGLGVGLSLVKRLVELHDGTVTATSPGIGHGSAFIVDLPIDLESPRPSKMSAAREKTVTKKGLRILLVDDSVDAVNLLKLLLENMGHDVEVTHEGKSALQLAQTFVPHVILLDIALPGMDGYEIARELRKSPVFQETKIIALTGYGQEKDREKAFSSGFSHHFIKPLDIDELTMLLNESVA